MRGKIAIVCAVLCCAAPAFAGGLFQPDGVQPIDPKGDYGPQRVQLPPDPEGKAVELRMHGKCDQAIPILRGLAAAGHDDIARYNLGLCLIDVAKTDPNRVRASHNAYEGAEWLLSAANHGLPNAQEGLVSVFLNGFGVRRDPVQAAKWSLIYRANGMRLALGMPNISADLQARLDKALNAQGWDKARDLADNWSPSVQTQD